jgi:predicted ATP-dependent endonuclease of OLD family
VLYTAHSPYMIDVENIGSLRTVEDVVIETKSEQGAITEQILGTRIGNRVLSHDQDTLFPLQGILGFNMTQTLFVGPYVLVVEGPTERALIDWFSKYLTRRRREGLDLRWSVCPAEGASKMSSFVTLFAGRGHKVAVLADYHDGQKKMIDQLEDSGLLETGHLFRTGAFCGSDESDLADLVGRELYVHLVHQALNLPEDHYLPKEKPEEASQRVVKEVEDHWVLLPLPLPVSEFNLYAPVEYLLGLSADEAATLPGLEDALDRFEALFRAVNNLISVPVPAT